MVVGDETWLVHIFSSKTRRFSKVKFHLEKVDILSQKDSKMQGIIEWITLWISALSKCNACAPCDTFDYVHKNGL